MTEKIIESIRSLEAVRPFVNLQALNRNNSPVLAAVIQFVEFGHTEYLRKVGPHPSGFNGWEVIYNFPNGYGASVVRYQIGLFGLGIGSYGAEDDLWQLAVLDKAGHLCYSTPVTDEVLGWLTPADVNTRLAEIMALPPCQEGDDSSPDQGDFFFEKYFALLILRQN